MSMPTHIQNRRPGIRSRHAQQGQTILIALLVLLLLGFIGGLFASIVTRSLRSAARSNRVQTADYYAEAGARFADDQLTYNPDGADWRPPLQYLIQSVVFQPKDAVGSKRYAAAASTLTSAPAADPDKAFLDQGFTRYNIGTGRFLLRLTYDPVGANTAAANTSDPRGRYIKIESIGREGAVDPTDPTTYQNQPASRLSSTLVEYKAIGITDYARFETNPDKRSDIMALGVSSAQSATDFDSTQGTTQTIFQTLKNYPLVTTYGASDAYLQNAAGQLFPNNSAGQNLTAVPTGYSSVQSGGGAIHVNGTVRFYGLNYMYLNNTGTSAGTFGETAEIAGNLLLDNYAPTDSTSAPVPLAQQPSALVLNPSATPPATGDYVAPSPPANGGATATPFDTHNGLVRDSGNATDVEGNPRNVSRLDPPSMDAVNPATSLPRYKDIALNSPSRQEYDGTTPYLANASAYGYGRSIYVNNSSDLQSESNGLIGGYTLVDEWLHRTPSGLGRPGWDAHFYSPPGVEIVLGRQAILNQGTTVKSFYGVRLIRSDVDGTGRPVLWKNSDGTDLTVPNDDGNTGTTMFVSYTSLNASNDPSVDPAMLTASAQTAYQANPNNDIVIYAEGNVRVRGIVSAFDTATTASTTTEGAAMDHLPRHITIVTNGTAYIDGSLLRGNDNSSISVLAHDYVCINTTQFLAGTISDQNPLGTTQPGSYTGDPSLHALDFSTADQVLLQEFIIPQVGPTPSHLYLSGGPSGPGGTSADFDVYDPVTGLSAFNGGVPLFNAATLSPYNAVTPPTLPFEYPSLSAGVGNEDLVHTTFPVGTLPPNQPLDLAIRRSPGGEGNLSTQDFLLERAALLPSDIRIEAVLFAQTKSFFVIPGDWFNTNTNDNLSRFVAPTLGNGAARPDSDNTANDQKRFPFYGQPIDMKIIIQGSVSEARPADIAAQTDWMQKWGWIPQYHGNALDPTSGTDPEYSGTSPTPGTPGRFSPLSTTAPGIGLTLLYNPQAGYPYLPTDGTTPAQYLRTDLYGRPLPYTPKLPVCAGLLYVGQNTSDQPVLQ